MKGRQKRTGGFTLVEMMVSLLIGLMIMAAVGAVYMSGKRTYKARDAASRMQETGRIALRQIERGISQAGYPLDGDVIPLVTEGANVIDLGETGIGPTSDRPGDGYQGDRITLHRLVIPGDDIYGDRDCWGAGTQLAGHVVNSYYVEKGALKCKGSGRKGGNVQPIVDGIENIQFRYGVPDGGQLRYVNATVLTSAAVVQSVEVAILVNGGESVDGNYRERTYDLLDHEIRVPQDIAPYHPELDRFGQAGKLQRLGKRSYQVFRTIVPLRNRVDYR